MSSYWCQTAVGKIKFKQFNSKGLDKDWYRPNFQNNNQIQFKNRYVSISFHSPKVMKAVVNWLTGKF